MATQPGSSASPISPASSVSPAPKPIVVAAAQPLSAKNTLGSMFSKILDTAKLFIDPKFLLIIPEICHLAPILFTIGTFIFSLLTLNYPIALFGVAAIEATLLHTPLSMLGTYFLNPNDLRSGNPPAPQCKSIFQDITQLRFKDLIDQSLKPNFPHYSLYFLSFVSGYLIQSMTFLSDELSMLGEKQSNRPYLAMLGASMLLAIYVIHLLMFDCSSASILFFSVFVGVLVGIFISLLHYPLGGKQAVNTLFVPPIVKRSGLDYLCVTTP